ncbi:MAG TPA: hypothetical protein V6D48_11065 [Oculatellaceae cyanobacterium]
MISGDERREIFGSMPQIFQELSVICNNIQIAGCHYNHTHAKNKRQKNILLPVEDGQLPGLQQLTA